MKGCASTLNTYLSKLARIGSLKISYRYFNVTAVQKLSIWSDLGGIAVRDSDVVQSSVGKFRPRLFVDRFEHLPTCVLQPLVTGDTRKDEDALDRFWSKDVPGISDVSEPVRETFVGDNLKHNVRVSGSDSVQDASTPL
jgi:hypothetical protein